MQYHSMIQFIHCIRHSIMLLTSQLRIVVLNASLLCRYVSFINNVFRKLKYVEMRNVMFVLSAQSMKHALLDGDFHL